MKGRSPYFSILDILEHMKIPKEVRAGAVAAIALILLYWGINFLKGKNVFSEQTLIYALYDRVDGLSAARPVNINGFKIGQVNRVFFHPSGDGSLIVEMSITTDFAIPRNSIAKINAQSLLGDKSVDLVLGDATEKVLAGDTLRSEITLSLTDEVNKQVLPLKQKAEHLFGSIDTAMILLTGFLNEQTRDDFRATFESVRKSFESIEHTSSELDGIVTENRTRLDEVIKNIHAVTEALGQNAEGIGEMIVDAEAIADTLSQADLGRSLRSLNATLSQADSILGRINRGQGTVGKLINDEELYEELVQASEELKRLLLDVQLNPKRYVHVSLWGSSKKFDKEEVDQAEKQKQMEREQEKKDKKDSKGTQ